MGAFWGLFALLFFLQLTVPSWSQVAWTPIFVDSSSQVDLWTQGAQGCRCSFDASREDCACCVRDGGCPCGRSAPNRCSQCGLEQHCGNMCNITIDSRYLSARSGKSFGQIKSPSIEGPGFCWYLLQPDTGQRVEIQVYRLVSVGRFNGTSCEGGFLQLVDGLEATPRPSGSQICGSNERYAPPVVLFADRGSANLLFQVGEPTLRSQFLAFFSFTPSNSIQGAGFQPRGGRRIEHTECDWLYQDFLCRDPGSCVMASPGYPGLYPPNRQCKYQITTSSIQTQVHISFTALLLPHKLSVHYIPCLSGGIIGDSIVKASCKQKAKGEQSSLNTVPVRVAETGAQSHEKFPYKLESALDVDLNLVRGVIFYRDLILNTGDELMEDMKHRRVTYVRRITRKVKSVDVCHGHCATDYIAIYQGSTPSSPLLTTLCSNRRAQLQYTGPKLLLEFSSGPPVPPYDYNGFLATLEFTEKSWSTEPSVGLPIRMTEPGVMMDGTSAPRVVTSKPDCNVVFSGNETRSGHFDTRGASWSPSCSILFIGRPTDVVHVSLFNYRLRAPSCQSVVEVYDGPAEDNVKPRRRLCSPIIKHAQDPSGRFLDQQTFVSSDNLMTLVLRRPSHSVSSNEKEFMDGAFLFHDEQIDGTLRPDTLCDVDYYGLSSPREGQITNPGTQQLFWNIEGALRCSQRFIPAANQSVTITVTSLARLSPDPHCHTMCGDGGCHCVTKLLPLSQMDHLLIMTDRGETVSCLCGGFQQEWLPVSLRSWSPLRIIYTVAHYSWTMKGFAFSAQYNFITDAVCGYLRILEPSGEIISRNVSTSGIKLNHHYHQDCTWLLDSKTERQLNVQLTTSQNRPCTAWNVSVYKYDENSSDGFGELLHTFCPRDRIKEVSLPWKLDTVLLRLRAMTRTAPEYVIRWHSQIVRANTRVSGPTLAPRAVGSLTALPWMAAVVLLTCSTLMST